MDPFRRLFRVVPTARDVLADDPPGPPSPGYQSGPPSLATTLTDTPPPSSPMAPPTQTSTSHLLHSTPSPKRSDHDPDAFSASTGLTSLPDPASSPSPRLVSTSLSSFPSLAHLRAIAMRKLGHPSPDPVDDAPRSFPASSSPSDPTPPMPLREDELRRMVLVRNAMTSSLELEKRERERERALTSTLESAIQVQQAPPDVIEADEHKDGEARWLEQVLDGLSDEEDAEVEMEMAEVEVEVGMDVDISVAEEGEDGEEGWVGLQWRKAAATEAAERTREGGDGKHRSRPELETAGLETHSFPFASASHLPTAVHPIDIAFPDSDDESGDESGDESDLEAAAVTLPDSPSDGSSSDDEESSPLFTTTQVDVAERWLPESSSDGEESSPLLPPTLADVAQRRLPASPLVWSLRPDSDSESDLEAAAVALPDSPSDQSSSDDEESTPLFPTTLADVAERRQPESSSNDEESSPLFPTTLADVAQRRLPESSSDDDESSPLFATTLADVAERRRPACPLVWSRPEMNAFANAPDGHAEEGLLFCCELTLPESDPEKSDSEEDSDVDEIETALESQAAGQRAAREHADEDQLVDVLSSAGDEIRPNITALQLVSPAGDDGLSFLPPSRRSSPLALGSRSRRPSDTCFSPFISPVQPVQPSFQLSSPSTSMLFGGPLSTALSTSTFQWPLRLDLPPDVAALAEFGDGESAKKMSRRPLSSSNLLTYPTHRPPDGPCSCSFCLSGSSSSTRASLSVPPSLSHSLEGTHSTEAASLDFLWTPTSSPYRFDRETDDGSVGRDKTHSDPLLDKPDSLVDPHGHGAGELEPDSLHTFSFPQSQPVRSQSRRSVVREWTSRTRAHADCASSLPGFFTSPLRFTDARIGSQPSDPSPAVWRRRHQSMMDSFDLAELDLARSRRVQPPLSTQVVKHCCGGGATI